MDRFARNIVNGKAGKGIFALLLLAILLLGAGCHWGGRGATSPPSGPEERPADNTTPATVKEWLPPAVAEKRAATEAAGIPPIDNAATGKAPTGKAPTDDAAAVPPGAEAPPAIPPMEPVAPAEKPAPKPSALAPSFPEPSPVEPSPAGGAGRANGKTNNHRAKPPAAPHPATSASSKDAHIESRPGWAKSPEELVYRVDFIGITMGYARFRYKGRVSIAGKPAYHLNVRAWTSGVLSYIFPINETIDYYLDTETLAPIRQEFTEREKAKDDVALYDQETGRITYRYRETGKIRKQVVTVPSVYDPVSVAYYFRWRDLGVENRPRNVYGGRKIYQISSRILGNERIRTEHGEVDTIAVRPLIRRDGKPDDKGDLKIWFSNDERRVPVRLYAKFHKIKDWTLVGELIPPAAKAGG